MNRWQGPAAGRRGQGAELDINEDWTSFISYRQPSLVKER
jgi:hypothetical protein